MFVATLGVLLSLLCAQVQAQEFKRSDSSARFWVEAAVGNSPDSGMFHSENSAVADRKDLSLRYQHDTLGVVVNYHQSEFSSDQNQEFYTVNNAVYGLGMTLRWRPLGEKGGLWGGSHLIFHLMAQSGRSDYHYSEGPDNGNKTEVKADIIKATGFASGADFYFPGYFGTWLSAGGGFESNPFSYKITSDPNGDGEVNISQTFTYLRIGAALAF